MRLSNPAIALKLDPTAIAAIESEFLQRQTKINEKNQTKRKTKNEREEKKNENRKKM